ncbi:DNA cytosine methyltransferase [Delftia sp. HK171]|uniref:DNA cytosine methyltransferase n=1 Tax=Delftia sp. HK171 TaxID=1920191 RepID=UPI0021AB8146|nr:DNA cytosine methyltransferase [Delftia sp. HK171]
MYNDKLGIKGLEKKKECHDSELIKVVSFFSGCGGLDLGFKGGFEFRGVHYERTKFDILGAYEIDKKCKITYESNLDAILHNIDLEKASPEDFPSADVLIGGFPCQDFSICGPRAGVEGKRGGLFRAMSRYAKFWQPKIVVAENVPHLPKMNSGRDLATIKRSFALAGYRMLMWPVYAPDYGVPQARSRVILIFIRKDIKNDPAIPPRSHENNHRSVSWAIEDLIDLSEEVPNQDQFFKAAKAKNGNGQGDEISPRDTPGYTVRANAKSRVQFHYSLNRRLTIRESARLQTFPDDFIFPHDATSNIMQIGNAVPPVLGHAIAQQLASYLKSI